MSQPEFEYLGPYKVERILGRGGMGTVYQGRHIKSGEPVAVKVIAAGIANNMRFRRRFAAEVETLKRLKHANIVQLLGYGEEQGLLFYSMEYVEGQSLHERLRHNGPLSWSDVIPIGIEVTSALKHAHDFGIIHRDLKPANLMLNAAGHVKLTDFGIAKLFGSSDMTAVGSVIGTADYMPPEQAEGKPVTVRSDLYSLGGVLYALLSGKAPFGGKSVPEVLYSVRYNPVPDLLERAPDVPPELAELIHHLLEKDPLKRPPTALVVGNRLRSLQQGLQHLATRVEAPAEDTIPKSSSHIAAQLTSLDLSDVDDDELKLTGEEASPDERVRTHADDETYVTQHGSSPADSAGEDSDSAVVSDPHDLQTLIASDSLIPPPSDEVATSARSVSAGDIRISGEFHSLPPDTGVLTGGGPSHFTPIDGREKSTSLNFEEQTETGFDWLHYGSIAGMLLTLLASIAFGWWLLRPDSADAIYDEITQAVDSGDDGALLQSSGRIDEFLRRFPKDPRADELQVLSDEVELARWSRILQRRAARAGGSESLDAMEQAFLESVQLLSKDAVQAHLKLAAFLDVFGTLEDLPRDKQKMVGLAEHALRRGTQTPTVEVSEAARELQTLIQQAEAELPPEKLPSYYRNLLLLYAEKPWAAEQINRIRSKLDQS